MLDVASICKCSRATRNVSCSSSCSSKESGSSRLVVVKLTEAPRSGRSMFQKCIIVAHKIDRSLTFWTIDVTDMWYCQILWRKIDRSVAIWKLNSQKPRILNVRMNENLILLRFRFQACIIYFSGRPDFDRSLTSWAIDIEKLHNCFLGCLELTKAFWIDKPLERDCRNAKMWYCHIFWSRKRDPVQMTEKVNSV